MGREIPCIGVTFIVGILVVFSFSFSLECLYKENNNCILYYLKDSFEEKELINRNFKNYLINIKEGASFWCLEDKGCKVTLNLAIYDLSSRKITLLKSSTFKINPNEVRDLEISASINETKFSPGYYITKLFVFLDGKTVREFSGSKIKIREIPILIKKVEKIDTFLYRDIIVKIKNVGNYKYDGNISIKLSPFEYFFLVGASPIVRKEKGFVVWENISIGPNASKALILRVTYIPLYLIPVVLLILLYVYIIIVSKIFVNRDIVKVEDLGDKVRVKVLIRIFNNKEDMKDVRIVEMYPKLGKVIETFPSNAIINDKEKKLVWVIDEIKHGEVIFLSYILEVPKQLPNKLVLNFRDLNIYYEVYFGQNRKISLGNRVIIKDI